jgi:hypothetical protein
MFNGTPAHLAAKDAKLILKREMFWANILTAKQTHTAEDTFVSADYFKILTFSALISRVHHEAGNTVHGYGSHKIFPHIGGPAGGHTAAALNTTLQFIDLIGQRIIHSFFFHL